MHCQRQVTTQVPTQARSVVEGLGAVLVSNYKPVPDVDYLQINEDRIDVGDISADERNNENDGGNNENIENEKNDTQNEDADPHKHAFQRKPRKRASTIWNDFEEVVDTDGSKKAKCSYCLGPFTMPSTGVKTQFHRHLKHCTQRQLDSKKQMVLSVETIASNYVRSIANFKYDRAKIGNYKSGRHLVALYGPQNWNLISDKLEGRSGEGKSCRLRWFNQLDPRINKRAFSEEKEERLMATHRLYGNKWAMIASCISMPKKL
ncbi:hypothetical protein F0562_019421 [Nyssa sinensis]|uniref:HTH myb-type domain-containing protein n=1 Tax=Nyssa sinensis TaxID=561372 RepID=A0A5J4ZF15_9ASTE|nr:hypothetical protein F0562_019421 [Nyssa sinensis]